MKILKFNENTNDLSSDWSIQDFENMKILQEKANIINNELDSMKGQVLKELMDFIILTPEVREYVDEDIDEDEAVATDVEIIENRQYTHTKGKYLEVMYKKNSYVYDDEQQFAYFTKQQTLDFIEYMKDPEVYKNAKKYNL